MLYVALPTLGIFTWWKCIFHTSKIGTGWSLKLFLCLWTRVPASDRCLAWINSWEDGCCILLSGIISPMIEMKLSNQAIASFVFTVGWRWIWVINEVLKMFIVIWCPLHLLRHVPLIRPIWSQMCPVESVIFQLSVYSHTYCMVKPMSLNLMCPSAVKTLDPSSCGCYYRRNFWCQSCAKDQRLPAW